MLLDGKPLRMGNGARVMVEKTGTVHDALKKLIEDPERLEKVAVFTDGVTIFVEDKA
jgi:hypothetical protein